MQWVDDVLGIVVFIEYDCLLMLVYIGEQFDVVWVVYQYVVFGFGGKCVIVVNFWDYQFMVDVIGVMFEQMFDFSLIQCFVEVSRDG